MYEEHCSWSIVPKSSNKTDVFVSKWTCIVIFQSKIIIFESRINCKTFIVSHVFNQMNNLFNSKWQSFTWKTSPFWIYLTTNYFSWILRPKMYYFKFKRTQFMLIYQIVVVSVFINCFVLSLCLNNLQNVKNCGSCSFRG